MERLGRATWPEKPRGSGEGDGDRPNTIVEALKRDEKDVKEVQKSEGKFRS